MFTWGGCLIKLLIGGAIGFVAGRFLPVGMCILMGAMVYGIISAWWFCCYLLDQVLFGSLLFIGVFALACWGCAAAPVTALRVISYLALAVICLGGVIADIWGNDLGDSQRDLTDRYFWG